MFAFVGEWPSWAVYGFVGAACGAAGALVGGLLSARFEKARTILVIIGIVLSRPLTENFVAPRVASDYANKGLPRKLDAITTLERVEMDGKAIRYFYRLSDTVPTASGEVMKAGLGKEACNFWKPKFKAGEFTSALYDYTFKDGHSSFVLNAHECE